MSKGRPRAVKKAPSKVSVKIPKAGAGGPPSGNMAPAGGLGANPFGLAKGGKVKAKKKK